MPKPIPTIGQQNWGPTLNSHLAQMQNNSTGGLNYGTTAQRPTLTADDGGYTYFDTETNQVLRWSGDNSPTWEVILTGGSNSNSGFSVTEVDNSPLVNNVTRLIFPNGTVTDLGNGVVQLVAGAIVDPIGVFNNDSFTYQINFFESVSAGFPSPYSNGQANPYFVYSLSLPLERASTYLNRIILSVSAKTFGEIDVPASSIQAVTGFFTTTFSSPPGSTILYYNGFGTINRIFGARVGVSHYIYATQNNLASITINFVV